ncbi:hypothetical protein [Variovorax gossypii]|uniref:hypothetical protein n=1 Tax=Variovorax gossypii TaxID=1679495 RepID=UPI001476CECF|nr:hypothetical protein [Variovorax gossypii]
MTRAIGPLLLSSRLLRALALVAAPAWAALSAIPAQAQFALAVSPPRLELTGKPGERVRDVIELTHSDARQGEYTFKTADWTLKPDGSVDFSDELAPGSCRPWVAIERREISIAAGKPYRYRFEVTPPPGTPPVECRFAVLIEGKERTNAPGTPVAMAARIGVIAYVAVGDVQPVLDIASTAVKLVNGQNQPILRIRNTGTAHGRLAGFLNGTDASGARLEFQPATTPIMPGETREIALTASKPGDADTAVAVRFPVTVTGSLEWGKSGSFKVNERFAQ